MLSAGSAPDEDVDHPRRPARAERAGLGARGEATEDSDVDLLVSTTDTASPWCPAGLVVDFEGLLGCRVQVLMEDGLYWLLRERILNEAKDLQGS
jgi:uncharacterized protein